MLVREMHPLNAPPPMLITVFGRFTLLRATQPSKAPEPMFVNLFDSRTVCRLKHPEKACCSIMVTPSPIVRIDRLVVDRNACCWITWTESGIAIEVIEVQDWNARPMAMIVSGSITETRPAHGKQVIFPRVPDCAVGGDAGDGGGWATVSPNPIHVVNPGDSSNIWVAGGM